MKHLGKYIYFIFTALAACLWATPGHAAPTQIFIPVPWTWIESSDAEDMAKQFCVVPQNVDTTTEECKNAIETCQTAVKADMLAKLLNLKVKGVCFVASGEADNDPSIYPFSCSKSAKVWEEIEAFLTEADDKDDFDAEVQISCKALAQVPSNNGAPVSNGTTEPTDAGASATGGCSLATSAPLAQWPSIFLGGLALALFGTLRRMARKSL